MRGRIELNSISFSLQLLFMDFHRILVQLVVYRQMYFYIPSNMFQLFVIIVQKYLKVMGEYFSIFNI